MIIPNREVKFRFVTALIVSGPLPVRLAGERVSHGALLRAVHTWPAVTFTFTSPVLAPAGGVHELWDKPSQTVGFRPACVTLIVLAGMLSPLMVTVAFRSFAPPFEVARISKAPSVPLTGVTDSQFRAVGGLNAADNAPLLAASSIVARLAAADGVQRFPRR